MKLETLAFVNESWPNTKVNNSVFCRKGRRGSVWAAEATVAGTTPHQQQHNGGRVKQKYFYRGGSELTAQWIQQLFRQRKLLVPTHPPFLFQVGCAIFVGQGSLSGGMFGERWARRMSPSSLHKQSLVQQESNPVFRSGYLYFLWGAAIEEIPIKINGISS